MLQRLCLAFCVLLLLSGCSVPRVSAEDRLFLDLHVDFLDAYELSPQEFDGTPVGGLSALAYDPQTAEFYALSDDRGRYGPPRFYRLALEFDSASGAIAGATVTGVTYLTQADGTPFPPDRLDPEGLALSPRRTVFISSEGDVAQGIPPQLLEFDRPRGVLLNQLPLPGRYFDPEDSTVGVQNNLSFEALTLSSGPPRYSPVEPFRLFTATESALFQDYDSDPTQPLNSRFLHYLLGEEQVTLIAEHRYPLDLEPLGAALNGLAELLLLDRGGHFLALERSYGLQGFSIKLYQLATGGANDVSAVASLKNVSGLQPIRKQLLLNFSDLGIPLDNLEGMSWGPRLADGSPSLVLIADNNFAPEQPTQLIRLRLRGL